MRAEDYYDGQLPANGLRLARQPHPQLKQHQVSHLIRLWVTFASLQLEGPSPSISGVDSGSPSASLTHRHPARPKAWNDHLPLWSGVRDLRATRAQENSHMTQPATATVSLPQSGF